MNTWYKKQGPTTRTHGTWKKDPQYGHMEQWNPNMNMHMEQWNMDPQNGHMDQSKKDP